MQSKRVKTLIFVTVIFTTRQLGQVCVDPRTLDLNKTLVAFAAERRAAGRPQLSIDISRLPGRSSKVCCCSVWCCGTRWDRQTDRQTDTVPSHRPEVFNLWSAGSFQGARGQPHAEKLETRRILTKQKYRPYQCCRYRLQRTELKTSQS